MEVFPKLLFGKQKEWVRNRFLIYFTVQMAI